jgi:hypothetical protein
MDFQIHRNLQEAYIEVYEQQKGSGPRLPGGLDFHHGLDADPNSHNPAGGPGGPPGGGTIKGSKKKNVVRKRRNINNSYDPYDLILSHLLDEGYAETPEAAEAIMVNMSEEWRDRIIDEIYKPLPVGRMDRRAAANAASGLGNLGIAAAAIGAENYFGEVGDLPDEIARRFVERSSRPLTRSSRIIRTRLTHSPNKSQARARTNRRKGFRELLDSLD